MMDDAYFTIRWKRLLGSSTVVLVLGATLYTVLQFQRSNLTARLLVTARQLAEDESPVAARVAYLDYLELIPDDAAARVELIEHVIQTEPADSERDAFVVSQASLALRSPERLPELRVTLVDAAMRLEWYSTVGQWLPTIQDLTDRYPRLAAFEGTCHLKKGEFHQAESQFKTALLKDPTCTTAWSGLIQLTELKGGFSAAIEVAEDWITKSPCAESYLQKAQLLIRHELPLEAIALYRDAVLPDGNDLEQVRKLAYVFVHEFPVDIEADAEVLQKIYGLLRTAAVEPTYDDLVCLADLAHRSKDLENAQKHYQECLENRPGDLFATGRQVELFSRQGLNDQAHKTLDRLSDSASQKVLKTTLRARLLAQEAKFDEAVIALEAVIDLHAEESVKQDAYGLLVECLWQGQRFSEAAVHAEKLLSLMPTSAVARRFCAEALIRSAQYNEAITCIHGFVSEPEEQINAVWRMLAHAEQSGQSMQLSVAVDSAALTNREATVPVLYHAMKDVDSHQTTQAVRAVKQAMVDQPQQSAFRIAVPALEERALRRMKENEILNLTEIADPVDRLLFLRDMMHQDSDRVGQQLVNLLKKFPKQTDVVVLCRQVLNQFAADQSAQRAILLQIYPEFPNVIREQGDDAVPEVARLLVSCSYHEQAFQFLTDALRSNESVRLIAAFCNLMNSASEDSPFHIASVKKQLADSSLEIGDSARQILQAECELQEGEADPAISRLLPLVSEEEISEAALFVILTHIDQLPTVELPISSPDLMLQEAAREQPELLLACSRWNRRQSQYLKSASLVRDSYLQNDRTELLIELAYIEWLANFTSRASQVLNLAVEMQLQIDELRPLHRTMLDEMQSDPRMPTRDFSQNQARSSETAKSL